MPGWSGLIPREITQTALDMAGWLPVVSVTGPRQSGKSTLVRNAFADYSYVNLEDVQTRAAAQIDPVGFIASHPAPLVIDEAQLAPDLFSQIQVVSDKTGAPGQYVLSGSQNFLLLKRISQSLAGRVGIVRLLPLSYAEVHESRDITVDQFMFRGGYPRLYDIDIPEHIFFDGYVSTYVERDVAGYLDVRNVDAFELLLRLCAQNAGSLFNISRLSSDLSVAKDTVRSWLSILESSYVIFRLQPHHANLRKRLTKTPKLYFYDTGLLCYLLRISSVEELLQSPYLGMVFENLVVSETLKRHLNAGKKPELSFYRDDSRIEVDLIDSTDASSIELVEIKSSQTYRSSFSRHLTKVGDMLEIARGNRHVVARVESEFHTSECWVNPVSSWLLRE